MPDTNPSPGPRKSRPVRAVRAKPRRAGDEEARGRTLLPYKNMRALFAYYLGVFSWVPGFGLLLSPVAMVLGILGYRYGRARPEAQGTGHAAAGILFGFVGMLLNIALVVVLYMYFYRLGPFIKK
jgi:hypothetical protein